MNGRKLSWQKGPRCVNCKEPAKCFLCRDCWRVAIIAPVTIFVVEHGMEALWKFLFL